MVASVGYDVYFAEARAGYLGKRSGQPAQRVEEVRRVECWEPRLARRPAGRWWCWKDEVELAEGDCLELVWNSSFEHPHPEQRLPEPPQPERPHPEQPHLEQAHPEHSQPEEARPEQIIPSHRIISAKTCILSLSFRPARPSRVPRRPSICQRHHDQCTPRTQRSAGRPWRQQQAGC